MRISDWSSDVCSSDLTNFGRVLRGSRGCEHLGVATPCRCAGTAGRGDTLGEQCAGEGDAPGADRRFDEHLLKDVAQRPTAAEPLPPASYRQQQVDSPAVCAGAPGHARLGLTQPGQATYRERVCTY